MTAAGDQLTPPRKPRRRWTWLVATVAAVGAILAIYVAVYVRDRQSGALVRMRLVRDRDKMLLVHYIDAHGQDGEHVISESALHRPSAMPGMRTTYRLLASIEEWWLNK